MRNMLSGLVGIIACAVAGPALALTLECKVPSSLSGGGYITELYVFQYDEGTKTALVSDGLILYYLEAPVEAKVTDTPKKLAFSWTVILTNSSGQQTKMSFRAAFFRSTKKVTVIATPGSGYVGDFEGRGTCREV